MNSVTMKRRQLKRSSWIYPGHLYHPKENHGIIIALCGLSRVLRDHQFPQTFSSATWDMEKR